MCSFVAQSYHVGFVIITDVLNARISYLGLQKLTRALNFRAFQLVETVQISVSSTDGDTAETF